MPASVSTVDLPARASNGRALPFRDYQEYSAAYGHVCQVLSEKIPDLKSDFVIKGTGPIATQHLRHRLSWDLDLMTREAFAKPGPLVKKLRKAFGKRVSILGDDDTFFQGSLHVEGVPPINLDIFSGWETVSAKVLERSSELGGIPFIGLPGYAAIKVLTVQDRDDPKDIYDLIACASHPLCSQATREKIAKCRILDIGKMVNMSQDLRLTDYDAGVPGFDPVTQAQKDEFTEFAQKRFEHKKSIDIRRQELRRLERAERDLGIGW